MKFSSSRFLVFPSAHLPAFLVAVILLIAQSVSAQVVEIPDPNLEKAIRDQLNLEFLTLLPEEPITQQDMLKLGWLDGRDRTITDLTGIEYATNVTHLYLGGNAIENLEPLAGLTNNLWFLDLYCSRIQDITPLANLINLTHLFINGNPAITDITPLANLTNLTELAVSQNQVRDLNPLAGLTRLTFLDLSNNRISDLTPLMNLTALETLRLNMNAIVDITPLSGLKSLKELWIVDNPIGDFSPLAQLVGVELDLGIDLSRLDQLHLVVEVPDPNLRQAIRETLSLLDGVPLTQLEMLRLTNLEAGQRDITDLTGLQYATNLENLHLWENQIQDVTPLANLTKLTVLDLAYKPLVLV